jgi:HAMP domain-containing protein
VGLRAKFNLAIVAAFLIGFAITGLFLQRFFIEEARQQVLQDAGIMMSAANAVRSFTDTYIGPLAEERNNSGGNFVAASVPAFVAQTTFADVRKHYPDFTYREPALNPTNLTDRPTDWEADFIRAFRDRPDLKELIGDRDTPTGRVISMARPVSIDDPDCLQCHNTAAEAPKSMLAKYGSVNGFGWKLHEVVGAQIVSVPMNLSLRQAHDRFYAFMIMLGGVFVIVLLILNVLLHYAVIRPVLTLARVAKAVSLGDTGIEEYERKGRDEIAVLSQSFNRMRRSLDSAMRLLDSEEVR